MVFRRSLAIFLTLLFVFFSLVTFVWYAFSNTLLKPSFYGSTGPLHRDAYGFLLDASTKKILNSDPTISKYFTETDIRREIETVFTEDLFGKMSDDIAADIEKLKDQPDQPFTISLKFFRESLLTMAHNLSFELFKSLPICEGAEIPQENVHGIPTCVPKGVEYNVVSAPISETFEKAIYASIPEQIQYDLSLVKISENYQLIDFFGLLGNVKYVLYGILLTLIALIALLVSKPFGDILKYEGIGFTLSGSLGYVVSFGLLTLPQASLTLHEDVQELFVYIFSFVSTEMQKIALVFLAFGLVMILIQLFMKRR